MEIGRRPVRGAVADDSGTQRGKPGWLPFGCILALGEAVLLVVLVLHPGPGTPRRGDSLAASLSRSRTSAPTVPAGTTTVPATIVAPTVPATTVPPTPVVTVPALPATTVPARSAAPVTPPATRGLIPPAVPSADIAPDPDFLQSCSGATYDDSPGCVDATLQAIDNARFDEGLPAMTLPSNWGQLDPDEQLFVVTNLERTARGLPALTAMATALDGAARQGAGADDDPSPPPGFPYSQWGSNWAGAVGNPLEAMYLWMYDDGLGSANVDCTAGNQSGCWGHRKNVLLGLPCQTCVMGTAWVDDGYSGDPSMTELLVETSGSPAADFTWQQESPYLP